MELSSESLNSRSLFVSPFGFDRTMQWMHFGFFFLTWSLFRNKKFMLDEMTLQNASKFAILFLEYENPHSYFHFVCYYFIFSPNECPGLCRHIDQSIHEAHSEWKTIKSMSMGCQCHIPNVWQILKRFTRTFHQA